jgi:hypothetical protein
MCNKLSEGWFSLVVRILCSVHHCFFRFHVLHAFRGETGLIDSPSDERSKKGVSARSGEILKIQCLGDFDSTRLFLSYGT